MKRAREPSQASPSKKPRVDKKPPAAAGTAPLLATKKPRRARISRRYTIEPLDAKQNRMFALSASVRECMARLDANGVMERLRAGQHVPKPAIRITSDLQMLVHNVVLTTELFEDPALAPDAQARDELAAALTAAGGADDADIAELELGGVDVGSDDDMFRMIEDFAAQHDPTAPLRGAAGEARAGPLRVAAPPAGDAPRYYEVPLRKLNYYLRHFGPQFNSKRFTAVIIRNDELSAASLIFGSVKIVCTGCARIELALYLMNNTLDKIRATGYDGFLDPRPMLRNIVSGGRFPRQICTNLMTVLYSDCCIRVEQFPGTMVCREDTGHRVTLIFESGEICHSGAQTTEEIHHDISLIYPMILRCMKNRKNAKEDAECARLLSMDPASAVTEAALSAFRARMTTMRPLAKPAPAARAWAPAGNVGDVELEYSKD